MDCLSERTEKSCNKRSIKLSSDDSQCCWYDKIYFSEYEDREENTLNTCNSFIISDMKKLLKKELDDDYKKREERVEMKCKCYNRKRNIIEASYNTVTGDILIQ